MPLLASLNGQILANFAKPEVARDWLPGLTAGEHTLAIALTEPKGGSDAGNLGLKMERDGDHYILNGEKTSISAARSPRASSPSRAPARPRSARAASRPSSSRWTRRASR
jgi:cyclohexanecarboxyl-CoA dehydrogenase